MRLGYGRRLPSGRIPPQVWEALSTEWRGKINHWQSATLDVLGAELQPAEEARPAIWE